MLSSTVGGDARACVLIVLHPTVLKDATWLSPDGEPAARSADFVEMNRWEGSTECVHIDILGTLRIDKGSYEERKVRNIVLIACRVSCAFPINHPFSI